MLIAFPIALYRKGCNAARADQLRDVAARGRFDWMEEASDAA
jgi:hypothetical protein